GPDAGQHAQAGPRPVDEAAPGRPVRGERADTDGAAPDRGEPVQKPDRPVPCPHPLPGGTGAPAGVVSASNENMAVSRGFTAVGLAKARGRMDFLAGGGYSEMVFQT